MRQNNNRLYSGYGLAVLGGFLYYLRFGFLIKTPLDFKNKKSQYFFSTRLFFLLLLPIYLTRLLRLNILNSCISGDEIYLWSKRSYWIFDVNDGKFVANGKFNKFKHPLNPLPLEQGGILCGEYLSNPDMNAVAIYRLSREGFELVTEFQTGEINHVHSIINNCAKNEYIVLCGDFEAGASIWRLRLNDGTPILRSIFRGEQRCRACVAVVDNNVLVYATDTTTEANKILHLNLDSCLIEEMVDLPASVIYGCSLNQGLIFSTNLEASIESKNYSILKKWCSLELPRSFTTDNVLLYRYAGGVLKTLAEFVPKRMPYRLFQYPTCKFVQCGDYVICNYISLKKFDCKFSVFMACDI